MFVSGKSWYDYCCAENLAKSSTLELHNKFKLQGLCQIWSSCSKRKLWDHWIIWIFWKVAYWQCLGKWIHLTSIFPLSLAKVPCDSNFSFHPYWCCRVFGLWECLCYSSLQHLVFVVDQKHVPIIDQITTTWAYHGHFIFVVDQITTTWSYHGHFVYVVDLDATSSCCNFLGG